jgi:helix-turn-helix, Psq domain.
MPPNNIELSQDSIQQEGRLLLAIQAIKNKEISSIRRAADQFQVDRCTLTRRLRGTINRAESRANNHKMTQIKEESLKQRILSLDLRRAAPTRSHVREMANLLLAKRGSTTIQTVGEKWVYNYTQRYPELISRFSRRYDYRRAE